MSNVKRNKILLFALTTILVLTLGFISLFTGLFRGNAVSAETSSTTTNIVFDAGASVRTVSDSLGIRFTATVDKTLSDQIFTFNKSNVANGYKAGYQLGMIIVPQYVLDAVEEADRTDYLTAIQEIFGKTKSQIAVEFSFASNQIRCNYKIDETDGETLVPDGTYSIKGALVNLRDKNLNYEYQAVAYYTNGTTYYYSTLSSHAMLAEVANQTLENNKESLATDAITNLSKIVAKTVVMREVGSYNEDLLVTDGNGNVTVTFNNEILTTETLALNETFNNLNTSGLSVDLKGNFTYNDASSIVTPNGFGSAHITASAYEGSLNYDINVTSYQEVETDITGSVEIINASTAKYQKTPSAVANDRAIESNKVTFVNDDAYQTDAGDSYGILKIARTDINTNEYFDIYHVKLWSLIIDTKEEYKTAGSYCYPYAIDTTGNHYGYYKLNADIDCTSLYANDTERRNGQIAGRSYVFTGFMGVFDGCGHTLYNLDCQSNSTNGIVYSLNEIGVIKNVKLVLSKIGGSNQAAVACWANGGTIKDVEVWLSKVNYPAGGCGAIIGGGAIGDKDITLKNITVYSDSSTASDAYLSQAYSNSGSGNNSGESGAYNSALVRGNTAYTKFTGTIHLENINLINVYNGTFSKAFSGYYYTVEGTGNDAVYTAHLLGKSDGNGGYWGVDNYEAITYYNNYYNYGFESAEEVSTSPSTAYVGTAINIQTLMSNAGKTGTVIDVVDRNGQRYNVTDGNVSFKTGKSLESINTQYVLVAIGSSNYKLPINIYTSVLKNTKVPQNLNFDVKSIQSDTTISSVKVDGVSVDHTNGVFQATQSIGVHTVIYSTSAGKVYLTELTIQDNVPLPNVETDLTTGVDIAKLMEDADHDDETITNIVFGGTQYTLTEGKLVFDSDIANVTDDEKLLASSVPYAVTINTEAGNVYSFSMTLYSLIIDNETELKAMKSYQTGARKGVYKLNADIALESMISSSSAQLGSTTGGFDGFKGYFDGCGHTISNYYTPEGVYGGFFGGVNGATVKNLNIVYKSDATTMPQGVLFERAQGNTLVENVTVDLGQYWTYGNNTSLLITNVANCNLTLKNVTLLADRMTNLPSSRVGMNTGILAQRYHNASYTIYEAGKIYVDNVKVVLGSKDTNPVNYKMRLFGGTYSEYDSVNKTYSYSPMVLGNGVELATGATTGITIYGQRSDYLANENGIVVGSLVELDDLSVASIDTVDFEADLKLNGVAKVLDVSAFVIPTGKNAGTYVTSSTTRKFSTAGTYTVYIRDTEYKYYKVEITSFDLNLETISAPTMGDLKSGVDVQGILDDAGFTEDTALTFTMNGVDYDVDANGKVEFATVTNALKAYARDTVRTVTIRTATSLYTVDNFKLASLIINNETDLLDMTTYQDTASDSEGKMMYGYFVLGSNITMTSNFTESNQLGNNGKSVVYNGFAGTFDGQNYSINNFGSIALLKVSRNATVKNVTINGSNNGEGVIANYVKGITISDVTINVSSLTANPSNQSGLISGALFGSSSVTLTNVDVAYSGSSKYYKGAVLFGSEIGSSGVQSSYEFAGTITASNVVVAGTNNLQATLFRTSLYASSTFSPIYNGNGLSGTIKVFGDYSDYQLDNSNYYTFDGLTTGKEIEKHTGETVDFSTILGANETIYSIVSGVSKVNANTENAYTLTAPSETGEYTYYVYTNNYKIYEVTLSVIAFVNIDLGDKDYDIQDGILIDTFISQSGYSDTATTVTFNSKAYSVSNGKVTFAVTGTEDARALASLTPYEVTVETTSGQPYSFTMTLYSMIIESEDDFLAMTNYEYTYSSSETRGYFLLNNDITIQNGHWTETTSMLGYTPTYIGGSSSTTYLGKGFSGTFDGNNHTVTFTRIECYQNGLYSGASGGIFYALKGTVKNLTAIVLDADAQYGQIARFVNDNATFENVTVDLRNLFSYGTGGLFVGHIVYPQTVVTFKDCKAYYRRTDVSAQYKDYMSIFAKGYDEGAGMSYKFTTAGSIIIDNCEFYGSNEFGDKVLGGYIFSSIDGNSTPKTAVREYLNVDSSVVSFVNNGLTIYPTLVKENGYTVAYTTLTESEEQGVGTAYNFTSKIGSGEVVKAVYDLSTSTATTIDGYTTTCYNRPSVEVTSNSITLPSIIGTYSYFVKTTTGKYYSISITTKQLSNFDIDTVYRYDLKDGFNVNTMLTNAGYTTDSAKSVTLNDTLLPLNTTTGEVSFGAVSDMTKAVKALPNDGVLTLTVAGTNGIYNFTNFNLYSILVSDSDELRAMSRYLCETSSGWYDGIIGLDADITFSGSWTTSNMIANGENIWGGFTGVLDGLNHKISNFNNTNGSLMASAYGATIRNISIAMSTNTAKGAIADFTKNVTVENVTVSGSVGSFGGGGYLFREIWGSDNIRLKNVVINSSYSNSDYSSNPYIAGMYTNALEHTFTGKILVDNVSIIDGGAHLQLVAGNYRKGTTWSTNVLDYGDGVDKADGASVGIKYFTSLANYNNNIGYESNITTVDVSPYAGFACDFSTHLGGETAYYLKTSIAQDSSGIYKKSASHIYASTGSYTASIRTTTYNYYIFNVTVIDAPQEYNISTTVSTDLKDGFNVNSLLSAESITDTISSVSIGSSLFTPDASGNISFGAVSDMTNAVKSLPKATAQTVTLFGENGTYYFNNFYLSSLIVSDSDELREMNKYQSYSSNTYDGVFKLDADITYTGVAFEYEYQLGGHSGSPAVGFKGVIDGQGHTIDGLTYNLYQGYSGYIEANTANGSGSKFWKNTNGGIIYSSTGATIKNITVNTNTSRHFGVFGGVSGGVTLENVTVSNSSSSTTSMDENGMLFGYISNAGNVNLTNVNIIARTNKVCGWFGIIRIANNDFIGNIVCDNVNLISDGASAPMLLAKGNYNSSSLWTSKVADYGSGIVKKENATRGITFYSSLANYTSSSATEFATDLGTVATAESKNVTAYVNVAKEFNTEVTGTVEYLKFNLVQRSTTVVNGSNYTFTTEGTYLVSARTTDYKYYVFTVTVSEPVINNVNTAYTVDLKDGFNINTMVSEASGTETITSVSIKGQAFLPDANGNISFGEVASMTAAIKSIPSDTPQTVIAVADGVTYNFTNVRIASLLISDADDLRAMKDYQYKTNSDKYCFGIYIFDADVEMDSTGWGSSYQLASGQNIWGGFTGVIDGAGHKLTKFNDKQGKLCASSYGATFRNLTIECSYNILTGVLAEYARGTTVENVYIKGSVNEISGAGFMFGRLYGSSDFTLRNVSIVNTYSNTDYSKHGLIGGFYSITGGSGQWFTGKVYVDNVKLYSANKMRLFGCNYITASKNTGASASVLDYGDGVDMATGATVGITYYSSEANLKSGTSGYVSETESVEIAGTAGTAIDFSTYLGSETLYYLMTSLGYNSSVYQKSATYTFSTAGTYKVSVRTTAYNYYIFTVTIS